MTDGATRAVLRAAPGPLKPGLDADASAKNGGYMRRSWVLLAGAAAAAFLAVSCPQPVDPVTNPTVVSTVPASGAVNVALGTNIEISFSEALGEIEATAAGSVVLMDGTDSIPGALSYVAASRTIVFNPDADLATGRTYTATVATNVGIQSPYSWSFTTDDPVTGSVTIDSGADYTNEDYSADGLDLTLAYTFSANAIYRIVSLAESCTTDILMAKAAIPGGGTETIEIPQALVSEGPLTVYVKFFKESDAIGSAAYLDSIVVDTVEPTLTSVTLSDPDAPDGANYSNSMIVSAAVDASDLNPMTVSFSNDNGIWSTAVPWAASLSHSLEDDDGLATVLVRITDAAGNETSGSDQITLDRVAPDISSVSINAGADGTTTSTVTLASVCTGTPTELYAVTGTWNGVGFTTDWNTGWVAYEASKTGIVLQPTQAQKQVTLQVRDGAGNVSNAATDTIYLDSTAPSAASVSVPATGTNGAYVSDVVTFTATGTDNVGIKHVQFYLDGTPTLADTTEPYEYTLDTNALTEASHSVYAKVVDYSGLSLDSAAIDKTVDNSHPAIAVSINSGSDYTASTGVNFTFTTATDTGSGVAGMRISTGTIATEAWVPYVASNAATIAAPDGLKTIYGQLRDGAGNESVVSSDSITLDTVGPGVTVSLNVTPASLTPLQTTATSVTWSWVHDGTGSGFYRWEFDDSTPDAYLDSQTSQTKTNTTGTPATYTLYVQARDLAYNFGEVVGKEVMLTPFIPYNGDADVTRNVFGNVPIEWRTVTGATEYRYSYAYFLSTWQWSVTYSTGTVTSAAFPANANTNYRWKVEYFNGSTWAIHPLMTAGYCTVTTAP